MDKNKFEEVINCFIVLGHSGWFNASLWNKDILSSPLIGAVLYVQKERVQMTDLEKKYCASENTCSMETQWGSSTLVHVTNALLKEALVKYPNCQNFWVVSGTSIPIVTANEIPTQPKTILEMGKLQTFYTHNGRIYLFKYHDAVNPITEFASSVFNRIKESIPMFKSTYLRYHSQWCRLSRQDAQIVSEFDYSSFNVVDSFLQDQTLHPDLKERSMRDNCLNALFAPDECYYGLALALHYHKARPKGQTTSMTFFQQPSDPSPIMFDSLDGHVWQQCAESHKIGKAKVDQIVNLHMTLREAIKGCRALRKEYPAVRDSMMTLRKVADINWGGQGLMAVVNACTAVVVKARGHEPMSMAFVAEQMKKKTLTVIDRGHLKKKTLKRVNALRVLHPNCVAEELLNKRKSPSVAQAAKKQKYAKRKEERQKEKMENEA